MAVESQSDGLLEQHFRGKKQMRPVYDALLKTITTLDKKAKVIPRESHIDLKLKEQFGLVRVRKHSVELGLHLPDAAPNARYRDATALNLGRVTHLARIADTKDIDADLKKDIKKAMGASR